MVSAKVEDEIQTSNRTQVCHLSAGFDLRRDQAYLVNARVVGFVKHGSHILPGHIVVSFNEQYPLRSCLVDIHQAIGEVLPVHSFLVDLKPWRPS